MDKYQINIKVKINHFFTYDDTHKIQIDCGEIKNNFDELSKTLKRIEVESFMRNNFRFSNDVDSKVSERIKYMENQLKNAMSMLIGNFYFKRIYHDNIEKRIMFVHSYFSTKLRKKPISFYDYLEKGFFIEQFSLWQRGEQDKRDYQIGKIRIFHLVTYESDNIIIFPLFVDSNHQIVSGGAISSDRIIDIIDNIIALEKECKSPSTIQILYEKHSELKKEIWKLLNPYSFCKEIANHIRELLKK